jgi:hypothetical protein
MYVFSIHFWGGLPLMHTSYTGPSILMSVITNIQKHVGFGVLTEVTMNCAAFWDVMPCTLTQVWWTYTGKW